MFAPAPLALFGVEPDSLYNANNMSDYSFQQLLDEARKGDEAALTHIVQQYESELTRVVKARLGPALRPYLDSTDLVQSVHKSILLGLRDDKFDIQSPQHLIRLAAMIVRRKIARRWNRQKRQQRLEAIAPIAIDDQSMLTLLVANSRASEDPQEEVDREERTSRVLTALPNLEREIIRLRLEGHSTAQAARILELDPDAVRARLGRIRQKLANSSIAADWL